MQPRVARAAQDGSTDLFETWPPQPHFEHAACRGDDVDPGWFFPERGDHQAVALARKTCAGCEHLFACRDYALTLPGIVLGIYGGWSQKERTRERRARRRQMRLAPQPDGSEHGVIDDPASVDELELDQADDVVHDTTRRCAVCDRPLDATRKVTCAGSCATEHERRRRSRNRAKSNGNGKRALLHPPVASASVAEPAAANDLAAIAALLGAGAQLDEIRLTMNGQPWALVRSRPYSVRMRTL